MVARFLAALLLVWPRASSAAGTWSVISLSQNPGDVVSPTAVSLDAAGNLFVADRSNGGRIQERDAEGNWIVHSAGGRGPGNVSALAADAAGNLYALNSDNQQVEKRDARGNWSIVAPAGDALGQTDMPIGLAVDMAGNLYIADLGGGGYRSGRVQERDAVGHWSVLAGTGDGPGQVDRPAALSVDPVGNLYVVESWSDGLDDHTRIQKRDLQGSWSPISLSGPDWNPSALAVDQTGNLYLAGQRGLDLPGYIWRQDAQGNGAILAADDGSAPGQIHGPTSLALDGSGNLYAAGDNGIQRRDVRGIWSFIATPGKAPGQILAPSSLAMDGSANLYVVDTVNNQIQERTAQGHWSVVATSGTALGQISFPCGLAADSAGNLYIADQGFRIQKRNTLGNWSVIAPSIALHGVNALAADPAGSLYVADGSLTDGDSRILKRDAAGNWSLVGTGGANSGFGQGFGLAADAPGNLYVADIYQPAAQPTGQWNYRVQERDALGRWSTIAAQHASALAADALDNLYIANSQIQKWNSRGLWSVIDTEGAKIGPVMGLAADAAGNLYAADSDNNRVLEYVPNP